MKTAEALKDRLMCPDCGEDWSYGWENRLDLVEFLAKKVRWCCMKCKGNWGIKALNLTEI